MFKDDGLRNPSLSGSATDSSHRNAANLEPETARDDSLAAIMRDTTIIIGSRVHPMVEIHLRAKLHHLETAPRQPDRARTSDVQGQHD